MDPDTAEKAPENVALFGAYFVGRYLSLGGTFFYLMDVRK